MRLTQHFANALNEDPDKPGRPRHYRFTGHEPAEGEHAIFRGLHLGNEDRQDPNPDAVMSKIRQHGERLRGDLGDTHERLNEMGFHWTTDPRMAHQFAFDYSHGHYRGGRQSSKPSLGAILEVHTTEEPTHKFSQYGESEIDHLPLRKHITRAWLHVHRLDPTLTRKPSFGPDRDIPVMSIHQNTHLSTTEIPLREIRKEAGMSQHGVDSMAFKDHDEKDHVYVRFGDWPEDERSTNWAMGHKEEGVSVYHLNKHGDPIDPDGAMDRGNTHDHFWSGCEQDEDGDWDCGKTEDDFEPDPERGNDTYGEMRDRIHKAERAFANGVWDAKNARGHLVKGDHAGWGHDDEPLLKNVRRVGDWIAHRHHFIPTAEPHPLLQHHTEEDEADRKEYHEADFGPEEVPHLQAHASYDGIKRLQHRDEMRAHLIEHHPEILAAHADTDPGLLDAVHRAAHQDEGRGLGKGQEPNLLADLSHGHHPLIDPTLPKFKRLSSKDELPAEWRDHIESFKPKATEKDWDLSTPEGATNNCGDAAEEFQVHCGDRGASAWIMEYDHLKNHPPRRPNNESSCSAYGHAVNYLADSGHIIDWTARQFDPKADFPHVEHIESYRKRWHHSDHDEELSRAKDCPECREHFGTVLGSHHTAIGAFDHQDWSEIYDDVPDEVHRGVGVNLPDDLHRYVHDDSQPVRERAKALLRHLTTNEARQAPDAPNHHPWTDYRSGLGTSWSSDQDVSERFAEENADRHSSRNQSRAEADKDKTWGHYMEPHPDGDYPVHVGKPGTAVVLHAHKPELHEIDDDLNGDGSGTRYTYHGHGEQEVPVHGGTPMRIKGISWRPVLPMEHPDYVTDPETYTRHDFDQPQHHEASRGNWSPVEHVPLDQFHDQGGIRPGDYKSWAAAEEPFSYPDHQARMRLVQDQLDGGQEMRPIRLMTRGDDTWVADGHHRVIVYKQRGYPTIPAERLHLDSKTASEHDWRGMHRAPGPENPAVHEISEHSDSLEHPEYYNSKPGPVSRYHCAIEHQSARDTWAGAMEGVEAAKAVQGKPDAPVTVYRSVPSHIDHIHSGDWVTLSGRYAQRHAESNLEEGKWKILKAEVPAKHVNWDWGDAHEYGYNGPDIEHAEEHTHRHPELPYHSEDESHRHGSLANLSILSALGGTLVLDGSTTSVDPGRLSLEGGRHGAEAHLVGGHPGGGPRLDLAGSSGRVARTLRRLLRLGSDAPGDDGEAGPRGLTYHPKFEKDMKSLDKPVQKQIKDAIDSLARGDANTMAQTHPLTGPLKGWSATKASRGHRIVHKPSEDGGLFIGGVNLHNYDDMIRRLT